MKTICLSVLLSGLVASTGFSAPEVTWSVMHPTELDPAYMARAAAKAVAYGGVSSFEVCGTCHSGMGGMDGLLLMEPYPSAAAKRDAAAVRKIRAALKGCIAEAHKVGKKLYYWHREGYLPAGIFDDLPGLRDADGEIDLLGETFASYLRWKVRSAFEAVPELDGFVLTLTEADFSVVHNSNAVRYPPPKVVEKIVRIFCEEHAKRGKRFILRSFGSVAKDYEDIIAGGVAAAKDFRFEIETKATPYDFSPFLPDNPFLRRQPGTTLGVECDGIGEFLGAGYPPCAQVDTIHRYVTNARRAGADRYAIRIDRIANSIFDSAQEINLYAYMRFIADPEATPARIKDEWAARRWKGCEREMIRLADMSYEMVTKMEFLNGNVTFHQHPVAPCFKFLKAGGMFAVFRDRADLHLSKLLWGLKNWERTPGRAALLAEKDRSVALADEGVRLLESVRSRLDPAEYARQRRAWDIATKATRATRAFVRCGAAYFDDMAAGRPAPVALAAAVAAADREISGMMNDPDAGIAGLNVRHSAAVGQNLDRVYFIPLRWLCREYLNEYAAEAKVRAELKARTDVIDFVVPGGIFDDNRVGRPMHGAYPELVDGRPVRWIGNSIFPNGTIRVEFKDVPGARVEVVLSPKGAPDYTIREARANGVREVTIGKKGARHPAVVAVALVGNEKGKIVCGGDYGGHLQGVATDGTNIFWSFTTSLVRTDRAGTPLATVAVPRHHGDLCVSGGLVYDAVNLGKFNQERAGRSFVMAYDAVTLEKRGEWPLDMPHGAGGMTEKDGRFYVVGGLPATHESNYVYEYDRSFNLIRRHDLATGYTLLGIQTAFWDGRRFLFGMYGCAGNPVGTLDCPADLASFVRRESEGEVGILMLDGRYYVGRTMKGPAPKRCRGCIVRAPDDFGRGPAWTPAKARCAELRIIYEAAAKTGWRDCGYRLSENGYSPLTSCRAAFVPIGDLNGLAEVPAVGIGGDRPYSEGDLVRAVRRIAQKNEFMAVHVPGDRASAARDGKLSAVLKAVAAEAERLNVKVTL